MNSVFNMLMMAGGGGHPVPPGAMISGTRSDIYSTVAFDVTEHDNSAHTVQIDDSYGTDWEWDNPSGWNIKRIQFTSLGYATSSIVLSGDWRSVTDMSYMFYYQVNYSGSITINSIDTSSVTNMSSMFDTCHASSITINSINTSNVTDMSRMFANLFVTGALNVSTLRVHNVTDMSEMFSYAQYLTSINISGWNTTNVTDMSKMFESCGNLTTITGIESINVSNVTDMSSMFENCYSLTQNEYNELDLTEWSPVSAVSLNRMLAGCSSLESLILFNNNEEYINVTDIDYICSGCTSLIDMQISGVTCEECTQFQYCFNGCENLTTLYLEELWTRQVVSDPNNWMGFLGSVNGCTIWYHAGLWNSDIVDAFPTNTWEDLD